MSILPTFRPWLGRRSRGRGPAKYRPYLQELEARTLPAVNLLTNGDFEAGAAGFTTSYQPYPGSGLLNEGFYAVTSNPRLVHDSAAAYGDHTTGSGLMMAANGALTSGVVLWSQTVSVTPGTPYEFSPWVSTWLSISPARLDVLFNGASSGMVTAPLPSGVWNRFAIQWASGASTSVTVTIINRNTDFSGNDFAIDDLSLAAIGSGAITGTTFNDLNGNGARDSGEPPLAGWTVYVDLNDNGRLDGGEPSRTSDAAGNYVLTGLSPGTYVIRQVVQPGWIPTTPASEFHSVTLSNDSPVVSAPDFGNFQLGTVSGITYHDVNGNGVRDTGEPGLPGWAVYNDLNGNGQLDQVSFRVEPDDYPDNTILDTIIPQVRLSHAQGSAFRIRSRNSTITSTGSRAFYSDYRDFRFWGEGTELRATFTVPVFSVSIDILFASSPQTGRIRVFTTSGQQFIVDSATPLSASNPVATLTFSRPVPDIAFVLAGGVTGTGYVYLDNLRFSAASEPATITGTGGQYSLLGLRPGDNLIRGQVLPLWEQTAPAGGIFTVSITTSGETATERDFGNKSGTITGQVFRDVNGNGSRDAGEPGLQGWSVYLDLNNNGRRDPGEPNHISNAQGSYLFGGLTPGPYVVRQEVQPNWHPTSPAAGSYSISILDPSTLAADRDFANFQMGTISGVTYHDVNGNSVRDTGEPGLPGWAVYNDLNGNGQLDQVSFRVEPDDYPDNTILDTIIPQVRLSHAQGSAFRIRSRNSTITSTGSRAFYSDYRDFRFWGEGTELRATFTVPVFSVSIDILYAGFTQTGRIRVFTTSGQQFIVDSATPLSAIPFNGE